MVLTTGSTTKNNSNKATFLEHLETINSQMEKIQASLIWTKFSILILDLICTVTVGQYQRLVIYPRMISVRVTEYHHFRKKLRRI